VDGRWRMADREEEAEEDGGRTCRKNLFSDLLAGPRDLVLFQNEPGLYTGSYCTLHWLGTIIHAIQGLNLVSESSDQDACMRLQKGDGSMFR
jgi:hypothetical protein